MAKVDGDKIKERYEKVRAEYQEHRKRERQKRRKLKVQEDTERKIVAGEFVLFLLDNGEYDRDRFMTRLDKYLDDNRRRALFGLETCDETTKTAEPDASLPLAEQGSGES